MTRRRLRYEPVPWDGVARYHDGTPIDVIKRAYLDKDMELYDRLPEPVRERLKREGGVAAEEVPMMTGMR